MVGESLLTNCQCAIGDSPVLVVLWLPDTIAKKTGPTCWPLRIS